METDKLSKPKLKIASYCAYQERCQQEVIHKLYSYGLFRNQVDEILAWLITENYVNEERFARTYAGGKFRIKQWGRFKIRQALKQKDISDYCIKIAMQEIKQDDYINTIQQLGKKKLLEYSLKTSNPYYIKDRTAKFIIAKGYEPELVWDVLKKLELS